jgi:queuine tRNA-ribosyltransferase
VKSGEILGQVLLSWHNVAFFETLMSRMRAAIAAGRLEAFRRDFKAGQRDATDSPAHAGD